MSSRNATSSDLELAQTLSHRLVSGREAVVAPLQAIPGCVRFGAAPAAPVATPSGAVPPTPGTLQEKRAFESWAELLDWALESSHATTAFVMDPEGFAIAHSGTVGGEEIQGVGSQLMVAMSQTDRLDHPGTPALSVCVEYADFWITGLRLGSEGRGAFTLGFIARHPLGLEMRETIRAQVAANLGHL